MAQKRKQTANCTTDRSPLKSRLLVAIFVSALLVSLAALPLIAYCQDYSVTLTINNPTPTTYNDPNAIPVDLAYTSTDGTNIQITYNVLNGSNWVYPSNQSYSSTLNLPGIGDGTYTFWAWAIDDQNFSDSRSVTFTVVTSAATPTPPPTTPTPTPATQSASSAPAATPTGTPSSTATPTPTPQETATATTSLTPTPQPNQGSFYNFLLIGGIIAALAVVGGTSAFFVMKNKRVNEKSLRKFPPANFQDWVIKKFDGKPGDPSSGIDGYTAGGQPLMIKQSDNVSLADVDGFVNVLASRRALKGTIVAFNFEADAIEGKLKAEDNGIDLQMLSAHELLDNRFSDKIKGIAHSQVTPGTPYEATTAPGATAAYMMEERVLQTQQAPQLSQAPMIALKPTAFISFSITDMTLQLKQFLEFIHFDCVMGDKEETPVPIPDSKFGLMSSCDCAIITISAIEQERRYGGVYLLNSNIVAEISAAYLKYNKQVILVVEDKVELPLNLRGLKKVDYNHDILSSTAAIEMAKMLTEFKKI